LSPNNESVVRQQRFSDERKTDVNTKEKRRRGSGYVDNGHPAETDPLRELVKFYGAISGEAATAEKAANLYEHWHETAKDLLNGCSGNLEEAKALLRKTLGHKTS
jgi:hypothetical protein